MNQERTVVVAGGGYAGVLAANRLRGKLNDGVRVVLLSPGTHFLDRIRLHEAAARGRNALQPFAKLLAPGVEHVDGHVAGLDAANKSLTFRTGAGSHQLRYDTLILTMGSRLAPSIPSTSEHALALADQEHALRLASALRVLPAGERVAVIGGGLTAIELSSEIAEAHPQLQVDLVAREFVPDLAGPARDALRQALAATGVHIRDGCWVAALDDRGITLANGARIDARISVLAAGFDPAPLGPEFGLPVRADGRIEVDADLRVPGFEDLFVAGDLAAPPSSAIGTGISTTRMACATAMPLGAHAANQVARSWSGVPLSAFQYAYLIRCISVGRRNGVVVFVDADDRPTGRVIRGRTAALIKEAICRLVIGAFKVERLLAGAYAWPKSRRAEGPDPARLHA